MSFNPVTPLLRGDCAATLVDANRELIFFNVARKNSVWFGWGRVTLDRLNKYVTLCFINFLWTFFNEIFIDCLFKIPRGTQSILICISWSEKCFARFVFPAVYLKKFVCSPLHLHCFIHSNRLTTNPSLNSPPQKMAALQFYISNHTYAKQAPLSFQS